MANLSLIDTAERTLNGLLAELRGRDPTAHVTVITHSKPSARQAVLDTVIPLRSVGSLEGSHDQGSELHAKGGEAYSEALEEARRVLHDIKGLVTQRAIVMLGDGDVEGDALGESPTETCRALRDDGVPAYSILLNPSRAWLHMLRLSELTGGRELSNTATSAAMLDVILGGGD